MLTPSRSRTGAICDVHTQLWTENSGVACVVHGLHGASGPRTSIASKLIPHSPIPSVSGTRSSATQSFSRCCLKWKFAPALAATPWGGSCGHAAQSSSRAHLLFTPEFRKEVRQEITATASGIARPSCFLSHEPQPRAICDVSEIGSAIRNRMAIDSGSGGDGVSRTLTNNFSLQCKSRPGLAVAARHRVASAIGLLMAHLVRNSTYRTCSCFFHRTSPSSAFLDLSPCPSSLALVLAILSLAIFALHLRERPNVSRTFQSCSGQSLFAPIWRGSLEMSSCLRQLHPTGLRT